MPAKILPPISSRNSQMPLPDIKRDATTSMLSPVGAEKKEIGTQTSPNVGVNT